MDGLGGYYGEDGFGDVYPFINTTQLINKDLAAEAIYKLANKYPNQISIISIGPLSSLASAITVHEDLSSKFKDIFIMGGNAFAVGNTRQKSTAEWNFYMDPEAAHIVLSQATCPIHILTWEACLLENYNVTNVSGFL